MKTDPRVDAYIAQAPPFARPILEEARSRVGKACPSAEETIKWNVPFFLLGDKILASMAAFKQHVKVGVWTGMMPKFADVGDVEDLPPAKDFAQQLLTAAEAIDGAMTSKPSKQAAKAPAKKAPAKKAPAKKAAPRKSK
jgi:topoisomerase IA-like protein